MIRTKPERPIPFIQMDEMKGGISTQHKQPELRALWKQVDGQLICEWVTE